MSSKDELGRTARDYGIGEVRLKMGLGGGGWVGWYLVEWVVKQPYKMAIKNVHSPNLSSLINMVGSSVKI
jgi:hypothetical protein